MFLVFNRQKIFSYIVTFTSVVVLLGMAKFYKNIPNSTIETLSKSQAIENSINIEEWNNEDIEILLQLLDKNNSKAKLYITKEWEKQNVDLVKYISNNGYEIVILNK